VQGPHPRHAEVEQRRAAAVALDEEHVGRLEIAVDHAGRVGEGQRVGDADAEVARLGQRQPAAPQPRRQRLAAQPLHRQVRLADRRQAVGDVADDRRVRQLGQRQRLATEPLGPPLVGLGEQLDRHPLAGQPVARAVHRAHAAGLGQLFELEALGDDQGRRHRAIVPAFGRRASRARPDVAAWIT
jgi:hypothetical protein